METASGILMVAGLLFALLGVTALYRFSNFYFRVLMTSNIDAAGMVLLAAGIAMQSPTLAFGLKIVIIAVFSLITGPLSTHAILRSARDTGYRIKQEDEDDGMA